MSSSATLSENFISTAWPIYKGIFVFNLDTGHVTKHAF
jgi:hypothetical protein